MRSRPRIPSAAARGPIALNVLLAPIALAGLAGLAALAGCSEDTAAPPTVKDDIGPAVITDLDVTGWTAHSISLSWTAPGDDGTLGTAAAYDVRYATEPITYHTWGSAQRATGEPTPQPAGSLETFTIEGLTEDETYHVAVSARDDAGNAPYFSYPITVTCWVDRPANISDAGLDAALRTALGLAPDETLMRSQLRQVIVLVADDLAIADLSGLEDCVLLSHLFLAHNELTDVTTLAQLERLEELTLTDNRIVDIGPLAALEELRTLRLGDNRIEELAPLAAATALDTLQLSDNPLGPITPLAGLRGLVSLGLSRTTTPDLTSLTNLHQLQRLKLRSNGISDLAPLASLVALRELDLGRNEISSLTALTNLTALTHLDLSENGIPTIGALENLISLEVLNLDHNGISYISPLYTNVGIGLGDVIYIRYNPLTWNSTSFYIPALEERGVTVYW